MYSIKVSIDFQRHFFQAFSSFCQVTREKLLVISIIYLVLVGVAHDFELIFFEMLLDAITISVTKTSDFLYRWFWRNLLYNPWIEGQLLSLNS